MSKFCALLIFSMLLLACRTEKAALWPDAEDSIEESVDRVPGENQSGFIEDSAERGEVASLTWLEKAEAAWFVDKDPQMTDYCLDRVDRENLADDGRALFQLLCRKVYTRTLPLEEKGFSGRNISALFLDRDDLWIGTWTGGIARYSLPLDDLTVFRESRESLRVEKISDFEQQGNLIRLAGYSDLYSYEKNTSQFERTFPEEMERINDLAFYRGRLFASTVSEGLWSLDGRGGWNRVGKNVPSLNRINTLFRDSRDHLLIGTASGGIVEFDGNSFVNFSDLHPSFEGKNITSIDEREGTLLIGSYGEGGYLLDRNTGLTFHYAKRKGDFLSDYLLCVCLSDKWAFAGTLGGGLYALDWRNGEGRGEWISLGLDEGLSSPDTAALICQNDILYVSVLGQGVLIIDEEMIEKAL